MYLETVAMGKYKKSPRYNILSMRVTDEEKAVFDDISRYTRKSLSTLMREAIHDYAPYREAAAKTG